MLEVPASGQHHELAQIAGPACALGVAAGELERHGVVRVAVDQELRQAERQPLDWRGEVVAAGHLAGRPAEQAPRRTARQVEPGGLAEVDHTRLGDRPGGAHGGLGTGCPGGEAAPGGRPQRQMAAGRVADHDDPSEVERSVEPADVVDTGRDVLERGGPATPAAPAEAAVLEVPDGPAAAGQVRDERILKPEVVLRPPVAAVDQDGDGPGRRRPSGSRELPELIPPLPVGMPLRLDAGSIAGPP
jgi:hypothetical protein